MEENHSQIWNLIKGRIKGFTCLELGGPTELFYNPEMIPIYELFSRIDNINNNEYTAFPNISKNINIYSNNYNLYCTSDEMINQIADKYDLLLSSHVIEHFANPLKTLRSLSTTIKPDGFILSILPNKTYCWDSTRPTTTISHLIYDEINDTKENDMTHLNEILNTEHPWKAQYGLSEFKRMCVDNQNTRVMHHHCFDEYLVKAMHETVEFETEYCEVLPSDPLQIVYFGKKGA